MKLPTAFPGLDSLRRRMGAPLLPWRASFRPRTPPDPITVEITDLEELSAGEAGIIQYRGERVFLYIREFPTPHMRLDDAAQDPAKLRKFHIAWCSVLEDMKAKKKFDKYVVSNEVHGPFGVAMRTPQGSWLCGDIHLPVCQTCLRARFITAEAG